MRAISVKVNEVVGVAGFVVPGTLVDVLVTSVDQRTAGRADDAHGREQGAGADRRHQVRPGEIQERRTDSDLGRHARWCCPKMPNASRWRGTKARSRSRCATRWTSNSTDTKGVKLAALMRGTNPEPVIDRTRQSSHRTKVAPRGAAATAALHRRNDSRGQTRAPRLSMRVMPPFPSSPRLLSSPRCCCRRRPLAPRTPTRRLRCRSPPDARRSSTPTSMSPASRSPTRRLPTLPSSCPARF